MIGFHGYSIAAIPELKYGVKFGVATKVQYRIGNTVAYSTSLAANTAASDPHILSRFRLSSAVAEGSPVLRDALLAEQSDGTWRAETWDPAGHTFTLPEGTPTLAGGEFVTYVIRLVQLPDPSASSLPSRLEVLSDTGALVWAEFILDPLARGTPLALYGLNGRVTFDVPAKVTDVHPRELLRHLEYKP